MSEGVRFLFDALLAEKSFYKFHFFVTTTSGLQTPAVEG
jgi:hypothetical protein